MLKLLLHILGAVVLTAATSSAQSYSKDIGQLKTIDSICSGFSDYLGLAVPYLPEPDSIILDAKESRGLVNRPVDAICTLDKNGKIIDLHYGATAQPIGEAIDKRLRKFRFAFLAGRALPFPQTVPLRLRFIPGRERGKIVVIDCPITAVEAKSDLLESNRELLDRYFAFNDIIPPSILDIPPIAFKSDTNRRNGRYYTITALLKVDEAGVLVDISYPIPGMSEMNHPVMMALLRSRYEPATIGDTPIACEFLLTFRLFDNLNYPYTADLSESADTSLIATRQWFLRRYFNPLDLSAPALLREFPHGIVPASGLSLKANGFSRVEVIVNDSGHIGGISVKSVSEGLRGYIRDIVKRVNFYPAVDISGHPVTFTGLMHVEIGNNREVVLNPEWR